MNMSRPGMKSMPPGVDGAAVLKPKAALAVGLGPAVIAAVGGARRPNGSLGSVTPNPEVAEKAVRRKFTAEYKRSILEEADAARGQGAIGALLRREGLYSSHLSMRRRQRE